MSKPYRSHLPNPVQFGEVTLLSEGVSGDYIRTGAGSDSASLTVRELPGGQARVVGEALWGTNREYGPNIGTLDFLAEVNGNSIEFQDKPQWTDRWYSIRLTFVPGGMKVEETSFPGYLGMNVTFCGLYVRGT